MFFAYFHCLVSLSCHLIESVLSSKYRRDCPAELSRELDSRCSRADRPASASLVPAFVDVVVFAYVTIATGGDGAECIQISEGTRTR